MLHLLFQNKYGLTADLFWGFFDDFVNKSYLWMLFTGYK